MKCFRSLLLVLAACLSLTAGRAAVIFEDNFDGLATAGLNGTAPDLRPGTETWIANSDFMADGSMTANGSAWLPYEFQSGVYQVTLMLDLAATNSTTFLGISFITGNQPWGTGQFSEVGGSYATFALRRNRDAEFWAGERNGGNVDLGKLGSTTPLTGTLRLVLDTTGTRWKVDAFFTPLGEAEIVFDLNGTGAGSSYLYETNPPVFTGVGFTGNVSSNGSVSRFTVATVIPEPTSAALVMSGIAMAGLCFWRRWRRA